ncbi:MAG: iron-only hydrogenase system regulator [Lachnospiraceae bacterium]|nr:iron-only hydrogenase system regulator [Lachnospiraceae bacterium]
METRVAVIAIVVEDFTQVGELNHILHEYGQYIIGRMGIPYEKRKISLISVAMDAPSDVISAMNGKIGMLKGVTSKAAYSKLPEE